MNAVHPFREGNGRTMRHHAAQLARDAGHPIRIASIDKTAWMDASRHGFLTGDHRPMATVLAERSEEHTSELQSLMRTSYAVFCLKKKNLYVTAIGTTYIMTTATVI